MGQSVDEGMKRAIAEGRVTFGRATRPRKLTALVARPAKSGEWMPSVSVPLPPSANNLYLNVRRGRVPTKNYKEWRSIAVPLLKFLRPPDSWPAVFMCLITGKVYAQRDGDNMQKPLLDAVKLAGVIPDDKLKYVAGGCWQYERTEKEPECIVWFEPVEGKR